MKKSLVIIVALMAILTFALVGCSGKVNEKTVEATQTSWNNATAKEATDVIVIKDLNIAKLVVLNNAKISLKRTFTNDSISLDFAVNELNVTFSSNFSSIASMIGIEAENIKKNIDKVTLTGKLTLTDNKKQLAYEVKSTGLSKILPNQFANELDEKGSTKLNYGPQDDFSEAITQGIDLALSHFSTIFKPIDKESAIVDVSKLNSILKAVVNYSEEKYKDDPNYTKLSETISKYAGVPYDQILTTKFNFGTATASYKLNKDFIADMNITFENIQLLYNKKQFMDVLSAIIADLVPGGDKYIGFAENFIQEITPGVSCIEIGSLNVTSNYVIK